MSSELLRLERLQKDFLKSISNSYLTLSFFLSFLFGIETINTFMDSRSSLKNHTQFQTKMGKVDTRSQTKTAQKPYPLGWHLRSTPRVCIIDFGSVDLQVTIRRYILQLFMINRLP